MLHPRAEGEVRRLEALADPGAGYTVVPRPVLEALGCAPHRLQPVRFADGRVEEWPVAEVEVECEGRRATTTVLMGSAPGPVLLGATALEELGLGVDPINRRLVPVEIFLAADARMTLGNFYVAQRDAGQAEREFKAAADLAPVGDPDRPGLRRWPEVS